MLIQAIGYGQTQSDDQIALTKIKSVYQEIEGFKNFKTVVVDDAEEFLGHAPDGGASLTGYFRMDTLKKIVEWMGLSNKVIQTEYYFDRGRIVFVYIFEKTYGFNKKTSTVDFKKIEKEIYGRYYFANNELLDIIVSDKYLATAKKQDAADFLESGYRYQKLLKAKKQL